MILGEILWGFEMSSKGENKGFWLSFRWGRGSVLERRSPSLRKRKGEAAGPLVHDTEKEGYNPCWGKVVWPLLVEEACHGMVREGRVL